MDFALPVLLMIVAMGLVLLDIFVPSMGIMTVAALGCFVASLVMAFSASSELGWILVGSAVIGMPILLVVSFKIFPRTRLGKHMILSEPEHKAILHPDSLRPDLLGQEGSAVSRLRPSGVAEFAGERIDVVTRGEMVEAGTRVVVLDNRGNRILVRAAESSVADNEEEEEDLL